MEANPSADMGSAAKGELVSGALETRLKCWQENAEESRRCNSYCLWTNDFVVCIDPSGSTSEFECMQTLCRELPRQACICLTHCHADHSAGAGRMLEVESDVLLVCHVGGAQALRQGDASATLAGFMGVESPCYPDVMGLFAGPHPAGVERSMDTPGGGLRSLSIPIGTRDSLQVYHLAGHSPDSLCFRVGGVLFTGDVTELDEPGLDKDSARDSLRKLLWLLDHINIAEVYPGHGPMMPLPQARRAFEDALSRLA